VLLRLKAQWGRRRLEPHPIEKARILHDHLPGPDPDAYEVDGATWADLDLDLVYQAIDRTQTPIGAQRLYRTLRTPRLSTAMLVARERLIDLFTREPATRETVQMQLARVEGSGGWDLPNLLWGALHTSRIPFAILFLLGRAGPLAVILGFFWPVAWLFALALVLTNLLIHFHFQVVVNVHAPALGHLRAVLVAAQELSRAALPGLEPEQELLTTSLRGTRSLRKRLRWLLAADPLDVSGFVKALTLRDERALVWSIPAIMVNRDKLRALHLTLGTLDEALSIASWRREVALHCRPVFSPPRQGLALQDLRHPALVAPVGNDLALDAEGLVLTGSNMSGKTTFLKTVGVSAILGQAINTVTARSYEAPFVQVLSSIDTADDLEEGRSSYLAEAESILRLVVASGSKPVRLFIIDEIFRGTNPTERIAAAAEVLCHLAVHDIVLAATHDLELCGLLAEHFTEAHFRENEEFEFDFKLRPGRSPTRNAIRLLERVGFPHSIVQGAARRAAESSIERESPSLSTAS
jgi:hypothetical protein